MRLPESWTRKWLSQEQKAMEHRGKNLEIYEVNLAKSIYSSTLTVSYTD